MAATSSLKEAVRGEKSELVRQLLAENPSGSNSELAAMFKDRMRAKGIKEVRELKQIAQAFANEKATAKRKAAESGANGQASAPVAAKRPPAARTAASATTPATSGTFTLHDLTVIEELAVRVGGYDQLLSLIRWIADKAK
jgi:hypothetical protein